MRKYTIAGAAAAALAVASIGGGSLAGAQDSQPGADDRLTPRSVTFTMSPKTDRRAPWRYTVRGRVTFPPGLVCPPGQRSGYYCLPLPRERACERARVAVRFKAGSKKTKTVSLRRVAARRAGKASDPPFCTFRSTVQFSKSNRSRLRPGSLKVTVQFLGNAFYKQRTSRTQTARAVGVGKSRSRSRSRGRGRG